MRHFLTTLCLVILSANSFAQNYDNLKILYADANYEKLVKKATSYTEGDKTKKDVIPYIYAAKGLYKISLSGTDDERFKNAYKDGIKYIKKGLKIDMKYNDGATFEEHKEFWHEFQASLFETIDNEVSGGGFKKAYGWVVKYKSITTNQAGVLYMSGACKFEDQDKSTARMMWQDGLAELEKITEIDSWSEADRNLLKVGVLYSARALKKSRQEDKAKDLLGKVAQWFENDPDWQERYDLIVNN